MDETAAVAPTVVDESADGEKNSKTNCRDEAIHLLVLAASFAALVPLWFSFEHRLPTIDESGHILNALTYSDLLHHIRPLKGAWWHSMLTVNQFYPPFAHLFNGALKALFGHARSVDIAALTFFNVVLTTTVYGTARLLTRSSRAALFAAAVVNLYPEIALLDRCFWLDFPLVSMCSAALFSIVWWRDKPSFKRAIAAGIMVGLACATKQIAAVYLALPGIFCFIEKVVQFRKTREKAPIVQLIIVAIITVLIFGPWLLTNYQAAKATAEECATHLGDNKQTFIGNLRYYGQCLPMALSPLLLLSFLASFVASGRAAFQRLAPAWLFAIGGLVAISTLQWIFPKPQYLAPAFSALAIVTGLFFANLQTHKLKPLRYIPPLVMIIALMQMISLEFAPYPIEKPVFLRNVSNWLGNTINEPRLSIDRIAPHESEETGQTWVIDTIDSYEHGRPVWLNVLSSSPELNVHSLEVIAMDKKSSVRPTTSFEYSIAGNTIHFSPEKAMYYQWYLIHSDLKGLGFEDEQSKHGYEQLTNFVEHSDHFHLAAEKRLMDGSTIFLFTQSYAPH